MKNELECIIDIDNLLFDDTLYDDDSLLLFTVNDYLEHMLKVYTSCIDGSDSILSMKTYNTDVFISMVETISGSICESALERKSSARVIDNIAVSDVDFDMLHDIYKLIKKNAPDIEMYVRLTKNKDVPTYSVANPSEPGYYNVIFARYQNDGQSQIIYHENPDGSVFKNDLVILLNDSECKSTLSNLRNEVVNEISNNGNNKLCFTLGSDLGLSVSSGNVDFTHDDAVSQNIVDLNNLYSNLSRSVVKGNIKIDEPDISMNGISRQYEREKDYLPSL